MEVLYISYDGAADNLGQSQIIPYILGLSKENIAFTLLTFEKKLALRNKTLIDSTRDRFNSNIDWIFLKYHKTPTLIATLYDILHGFFIGLWIIKKKNIKIIHGRSFIGSVVALLLKKIYKARVILDMRGFWADERVDGHIWKNKGLLYKFIKWLEKALILKSDWVVCLTEEAKNIIEESVYYKERKAPIDVIPTCVDMAKFTIHAKNRDLLARLNLQNRFIFVYFGSIGTWYLLDEMIDFFKAAKRINIKSFFMVLTPNKDLVLEKMVKKNVNRQDYFINTVSYEEIPGWISLADASLSFIRPAYSKKSSCPSKFAESLACGLPAVINSQIGDTDKVVTNYNIGVIVEGFNEDSYGKAAVELFNLLEEGQVLKERCRAVAKNYFSLEMGVERYLKVYQKALAKKVI